MSRNDKKLWWINSHIWNPCIILFILFYVPIYTDTCMVCVQSFSSLRIKPRPIKWYVYYSSLIPKYHSAVCYYYYCYLCCCHCCYCCMVILLFYFHLLLNTECYLAVLYFQQHESREREKKNQTIYLTGAPYSIFCTHCMCYVYMSIILSLVFWNEGWCLWSHKFS